MSLVSVVCCQGEVSATDQSLVQRSPPEYVCVCVCVHWVWSSATNNPLLSQWISRGKRLRRKETDQDGTGVPSWSCSKAIYKPVWHIPLLSVQWINSWWWTEELPEICRVSWQNKFGKLVHLVGFIIKKYCIFICWSCSLRHVSTGNCDHQRVVLQLYKREELR
jgi:hypothetical protein